MSNKTYMDISIDESKTLYSKYFANDELLALLVKFYISDSIIFHKNKNIDSDVILKNTDAVDGRDACYKVNTYFQYRNFLYEIIKKGYFKNIGSTDSNTPSYAICETNFKEAMKQFQWNSLVSVQSNIQAKTTVNNLSQKGHVYNYYFSKDLHQLIGLTPFTKEFETKLGEIWPIWFAIAFRTGLLIIKTLCNYLERNQPNPSLVQAIENFIMNTLNLKLGLAPELRAIISLELSERNDVLPWQTFFHDAKSDKYRCSYFCLAIVNYLLYNKNIKLPTFYDTLENSKRSKYDIHAGMTDKQEQEAKIRFLQQSRTVRRRKKFTQKFTNSDSRISKPISSKIHKKYRYNNRNSTSKLLDKAGVENIEVVKLQDKMVENNTQESTINKLSQILQTIISSSNLIETRESSGIASSQMNDSIMKNFGDQQSSILSTDITIDDSNKELLTNIKSKIPEDTISSRSSIKTRESFEITSSHNIDSATENFGDQRFTIITIDDSNEELLTNIKSEIPEDTILSRSSIKTRESFEITSSPMIDSITKNFEVQRSSILNTNIITIDDTDEDLPINARSQIPENTTSSIPENITSSGNFGDQRPTIITIDDSDDESPKQNNKSDAITSEIFYTLMNNETLLRWDEIKDKYLIKFILNNPDNLQKDCTYKKLLVLEPQIFKGFKPENLRKRKEHLANSYEYLMKLCGSGKIKTKEDKVVFEERIDSLRKLMNFTVKMEVD